MRCSRVRYLLSEYLDGEIQGTDHEMIKTHLAECEACALAYAALRNTSRLLAEAGEVEPPAYLLAQIEAATVSRPTFHQRVRTSLEHLTRIPASARWATVSAAAAVAFVMLMTSHPAVHQVAYNPPVKQQTPHSATVTPPALSQAKHSQPVPEMGRVIVAETRPIIAAVTLRVHPTNDAKVAKELPEHGSAATSSAQPSSAVVSLAVADEATPATEHPVTTETPVAESNVAAATPAPDTGEQEIKIVRASTSQTDWQKREADSLAELRAKLAARNKQRRYGARIEPIEGNKVPVDLASIRF